MPAYRLMGMVMAAGLRAQSQDCSVNVYVNPAAELPLGTLFAAKATATRMFREIGVKIRMASGRPEHDRKIVCGAPIVIEFENAGAYHGREGALAYAAPYKKSGTSIHVFTDRVQRYRDIGQDLPSALLAYVMVHEITHVLEGVARHSDEGVMKAVWSDSDYARMRQHALPFAPEDIEFIRMGLARRISLAAGE